VSGSDVTRRGVENARPGREALTGAVRGRPPDLAPTEAERRRGGRAARGEQAVVPEADFRSYYGRPILNPPVWKSPDIPGYLYLGGLAGAASVLAAGSHVTGRRTLARRAKAGALGALGLGTVALVHDLGRPSRFANMLRVFKPTSPMSVGSWLLAAYGPAAGLAALSDLTGIAPVLGAAATAGAAALGPAVASYTGVLVSDTAVPAWHDGYREMPFVFAGSAATAAAGLGLLVGPLAENAPARRLAVLGAAAELAAASRMERREGMVAEPYRQGRAGAYMRAGEVLSAAGVAGGLLAARRSRVASALSGAALMAASACTRWGIFHAGMASARDPRYTVVPQRRRLDERAAAG
jgi:DMSO reductase anchor subunit